MTTPLAHPPLDDTDALLDGLLEAPHWPEEVLRARVMHLATQPASNLFWDAKFDQAMATWAQTDRAPGLFEALHNAFMGRGKSILAHRVGNLGRLNALRLDRVDLFLRLSQTPYVWSAREQAEAADYLLDLPSVSDRLKAAFWGRIPGEDSARVALYRALSRDMDDLWKGIPGLVRLHAAVPEALPSHLVAGLTELFYYHRLELDPDADDDLGMAWALIRPQVDASSMLSAFVDRVGDEDRLQAVSRQEFAAVVDLFLADASPALHAIWLKRSDLALPRTRAAHRQQVLEERPPTSLNRPRLRS